MFGQEWETSLFLALKHATNARVVLCSFVCSLFWSLPLVYFQRLKVGWLLSLICMLPVIFSIESMYLYFWPPKWQMPLYQSLLLSMFSTWRYILPLYFIFVILPFWPTKKKSPRSLTDNERKNLVLSFTLLSFTLLSIYSPPTITCFVILPLAILMVVEKLHK